MSAPSETPLFFDSKNGQLYGVFYPAEGSSRHLGLVLCPALGQEADLSLRVLVEFARAAAKAGLDVLRFDYRGCGESEGEFDEGTLEGWSQDIETAVSELRVRRPGIPMCLMGLRLGGTLALIAAGRGVKVDGLLLWAPIGACGRYVDELLQLQLLAHNLSARMPLKDRRDVLALGDGTVALLGYQWKKQTLMELEAITPADLLRSLVVPTLLCEIRKAPTLSPEFTRLHELAQGAGKPMELSLVEEDAFWQTSNQPWVDLVKWKHHERLFQESIGWLTRHTVAGCG